MREASIGSAARRSRPRRCSSRLHRTSDARVSARVSARAIAGARTRVRHRALPAQLGIVWVGVAMHARIVVGIVTAREHTGRGIVGIDTLVRAFEVVGLAREIAAGCDELLALILG